MSVFVQIILSVLQIFTWLLIGRAILSWFRIGPDSPIAPLVNVLYAITEPVLGPIRRVVPPAGMFDLSIIIAFVGIFVLQSLVSQLA